MIWLHGVSVGESLANLTLAKALVNLYPDQKILLTSTSKTSRSLLLKAVNDQILYDSYPLDFPWRVNAFLDKWQPKAVIFGESELWPFMLHAIQKRGIKAALVNARMSETSYKRWRLVPFLARKMVKTFDVIMAQSDKDADQYRGVRAQNVYTTGNLKFAADPLSYDPYLIKSLKDQIGDRPLLTFASTHAPEEIYTYQMHQQISKEHKNLLSILVPRHPKRAEKIREELEKMGAKIAQRSLEDPIHPDTDIYLADTMGELGNFYAMSDIVFLGNSLTTTPGGGHNAIEPAHLNCAIVYGPHMFNFELIDREMLEQNAVIKTHSIEETATVLTDLLKSPEKVKTLSQHALSYAQSKQNVLPEILEKLLPLIDTALGNNEGRDHNESSKILVSSK